MKYEPLERHLQARTDDAVALSFEEIERIIGAKLPDSARKHPAWWSNNPTNHVNAQAWLGAGYRTEQVDLSDQRLVFRRRSKSSDARHIECREEALVDWRPGVHPAWGALKGTVKVAPGVDLTAPLWDSDEG